MLGLLKRDRRACLGARRERGSGDERIVARVEHERGHRYAREPRLAARSGRSLAGLARRSTPERARNQRRVPIEYVRPNPRNPRRNFSEAELDDLAASIKERGIIQPVVVRSTAGAKDAYEIIAGERRWRSAQRPG